MRKRLMLAMAGVLLSGSLVGVTRPAAADHCDPAVQGAECEDVGPALEDFIDITQVAPGNTGVRAGRGSFTSLCGRNENGHRNSDNHIVAPGVSNGAHHIHDYVGNLTTNGFSTDQSLAAGGTTCRFGDRSAYFWPVLRSRTGQKSPPGPSPTASPSASPTASPSASPTAPVPGSASATPSGTAPRSGTAAAARPDAASQEDGLSTDTTSQNDTASRNETTSRNETASRNEAASQDEAAGDAFRAAHADEPGGAADGNVGQILRARFVSLQFRGNRFSRVVAMPRFLRLITGDAKAATNGGANARAQWSCTGFTNRVTAKYPLCPRGSLVLRILDFPSCWDGQNTDSANHRTHVLFPGANGACPAGTRAIPQLRMTLAYSVARGPSFAVDSFPEQRHNPVTDHADFENVMPDRLMTSVVNCINRGRRC
ncbi:DUF1996 domain-containing protein [Planotetraspora sp. A-T 1434]|uniref:DUF1996 domain-containing protein n=1 Tax=Planotetraspora sp. A-T 1434 TaxID=2979219 RepID=UPI0021BFC95D|nr:DUF1996 domain-containing protein [Planotetraspora sp. A-T 1434]MCT9928880.1 DUF1996 domain-containing protein [Planotetraspora sp. A-T 1434]